MWGIVTAPPTSPPTAPPFFSSISSLILDPWVCSKALLSFVQSLEQSMGAAQANITKSRLAQMARLIIWKFETIRRTESV